MKLTTLLYVIPLLCALHACKISDSKPIAPEDPDTTEVKTDREPGDSTGGDSTRKCDSMHVILWEHPEYQWIDWYADGHKDTVSSSMYPEGLDSAVQYYEGGYYASIIRVQLAPDTILEVCANDSIIPIGDSLNRNDSLPILVRNPKVPLNFGPDSVVPLVRPLVSIANKAQVRESLDSLQYYWKPSHKQVDIMHFKRDSIVMTFESEGPFTFSKALYPSTAGCITKDPCASSPEQNGITEITCYTLDYPEGMKLYPTIQGALEADAQTGQKIKSTLRIKNRFGYTDSLEFETYLMPWSCPSP